MKILSIGTDREILNPGSDACARMLMYGPLADEVHIHCTTKTEANEEKIADNIWLHPSTSWIKSIAQCRKIIKEHKIDVIVSPDPFAKAWISLAFAIIYRKKFLLSVYGGNIFDAHWIKLSIFNRIYSWIGRCVFIFADAIQTDGLETYEELKTRYGAKVFWKPMVPANIGELLEINRESQIMRQKPNMLYIGRLIEQKNIPFLARVIESVGNAAEVTIVGDGPLKKLLPASARHYAKQERHEIVERFKEADMLVLTSYFEGFARVVMEAAAAGIPVITTEVSGIKGIVEHGVTGYVFKQGDEDPFIRSIKMLIEDTETRRRLGVEIRKRAQEMLSLDTMLKKQKEVYDYLK